MHVPMKGVCGFQYTYLYLSAVYFIMVMVVYVTWTMILVSNLGRDPSVGCMSFQSNFYAAMALPRFFIPKG